MDKTQLIKNIEEIESKLKEMKEELKTKEEKPFPQKGDTYFMVTATGTIDSAVCETDDGRFQVFRTKEEAINFYNVECARQRVKDGIKKLNNGWIPDWSSNIELRYFVRLKEKELTIENCRFNKVLDSSMYLKNFELTTKLIETHKDDLLLILGQ